MTDEPGETDQFYKVSETQDKLIGQGIRLLACKVLDLITLASKSYANMDLETAYTQEPHQNWIERMVGVTRELQEWEVQNVG